MRSVIEERMRGRGQVPRRARAWSAALALASTMALARAASAASPPPTYGRIDGDVAFVVGAGMVVAPRGVLAEAELRVRYLDSAGAFVTYEDAPLVGSPAEPRRCIVAGVELRPMFLLRWLQGLETEHAALDLWIDSIGLELGALWLQPAGDGFGARAGVQFGLGMEVPVTGAATGPWLGLRGGFDGATTRWRSAPSARPTTVRRIWRSRSRGTSSSRRTSWTSATKRPSERSEGPSARRQRDVAMAASTLLARAQLFAWRFIASTVSSSVTWRSPAEMTCHSADRRTRTVSCPVFRS
jgi:hypothetical protein